MDNLTIRLETENDYRAVEELDGYREYKQKVRYRLIPFIW